MSFVRRSGWRGNGIVKICERLSFDWSPHNAFESPDDVVVFGRDERERVTCSLGASRTSDAMDVGIGRVWHIKVDHVRNAVNVQTARRNVSSDHDAEVSCFEAVQGLLALSLSAVAVQAGDAMTRMRDLTSQLIGAMFSAGKNEYRIGIGLLE